MSKTKLVPIINSLVIHSPNNSKLHVKPDDSPQTILSTRYLACQTPHDEMPIRNLNYKKQLRRLSKAPASITDHVSPSTMFYLFKSPTMKNHRIKNYNLLKKAYERLNFSNEKENSPKQHKIETKANDISPQIVTNQVAKRRYNLRKPLKQLDQQQVTKSNTEIKKMNNAQVVSQNKKIIKPLKSDGKGLLTKNDEKTKIAKNSQEKLLEPATKLPSKNKKANEVEKLEGSNKRKNLVDKQTTNSKPKQAKKDNKKTEMDQANILKESQDLRSSNNSTNEKMTKIRKLSTKEESLDTQATRSRVKQSLKTIVKQDNDVLKRPMTRAYAKLLAQK